ncbi:uncharacterized protein [Clytia hemisphaerica]|uniref:uncharacterized protein n=1 Tax=Clytia hemisphaerica TaxID=252671 RepID=UPI0034D6C34D
MVKIDPAGTFFLIYSKSRKFKNCYIPPLAVKRQRTCYQSFTRPIVEAPKSPENEESLLAVINYVQSTVLDERELVTLDRLVEVYENALPRKGKKLHKRTLTDKVIAHFCGKVSMWSPKYGEAFLFNEEIKKGEIIEILFKKIEQAKEQKAPSLQTQIKNVGKLIKKNIKNLPDTYTSWPPNEDELISSKTHIPAELELFMTTVLTATPISRLSERKKAIISSLCEDVIYNSRAGRFRCSKQTKLGFCIKRKTGSKTLVGWMNKFGHCISYDDVNYLETILAMDAMYNESIRSFCPSLILPSIFVTFVWDNNDINPESIKGVSMHVTNGIVIQLKHESNNQTRRISQRLNTNRKRSFEAVENPLLKYNSTKKRDGPENKKLPKENESDLFRACELLNFFWAFLRAHSNLVPGWKGFNYLITPEPNDQVHNICYLPAINKSPTKMDAVLELLTQSKIKAEKLGLAETDVVLDQAIYAKACEILMNPVYKELKDFIVLRMGAFHAQCIFIAVIGKRFADAGLRDWIIEGDLIGSGSLEGVLNGKQYNYATRVLENVYDALSRFKVENFKEWIRERGKASENILERVISSSDFELCKEKPTLEALSAVFDDTEFIELIELHEKVLKNERGPTSTFWYSFIEMMDILFNFQRSIKLGDWNLHLETTKKMIPWFFAYDRPNYSRFFTYYWSDMVQLPTSHPNIYEEFKNGNFAVQRTCGKFNKVPSDQAIEQTINRDQKCHGGIKGYSTSPGTIQRWVLTSHIASKCINDIENSFGKTKKPTIPKDLGKSRHTFNNCTVEKAYEVLNCWGSPFQKRDALINVSSGHKASPLVENDLIKAVGKGETAMKSFIRDRIETSQKLFYDPITKLKLKTFSYMTTKTTMKINDKLVTLAAERSMFGRLLVIAKCESGISLRQVLQYSLSPIPWALGLPDGTMVKTMKSKLMSK